MASNVVEYRCLISAPGDVAEEKRAIIDAIAYWNAHRGVSSNVRVEPVDWRTHAVPEMGDDAQKILNRQIVENCDFGVAILWSRAGTPTSTHSSGTVEEIETLLQNGKMISLYVSEKHIPIDVATSDQFREVTNIKREYQRRGLTASFTSPDELKAKFIAHLSTIVEKTIRADASRRLWTLMDEIHPSIRAHVSSGTMTLSLNLTQTHLDQLMAIVAQSNGLIEAHTNGNILGNNTHANGGVNDRAVGFLHGVTVKFHFRP